MLCTFGFFILRNLLFSFNWMLRVLEKELHKTIINGWWVHRDGSSFLTWILLCVTVKLPVWQQRAVSVCPLCLPAPSSSAASTAPCWAHGLGLRGTAEMFHTEGTGQAQGGGPAQPQCPGGLRLQHPKWDSAIQVRVWGWTGEFGNGPQWTLSLYKKSQVTEIESNDCTRCNFNKKHFLI